jgi:TonB family protein
VRSSALIALSVMLATAHSGGQQPNVPQPSQPAPTPRERVLVYAPSKGIVAPRLIPSAAPLARLRQCESGWNGEVVLSLLVDTAGVARNIMFQRPSGSVLDPYALVVASEDQFQPGTLNGNPVVVAESLQIKIDTCILTGMNAAGKTITQLAVKSSSHQKLKKPKNPPQEVVFAPLKDSSKVLSRKVARPEYFGGAKSAPVLLYSAPARYTPQRDGTEIGGVCKISLVVDAHGMPQNPRVLKSLNPAMDISALDAVNQYRFFPAIEDEEPVPAAIVVDVTFTPPGPGDYDEDY